MVEITYIKYTDNTPTYTFVTTLLLEKQNPSIITSMLVNFSFGEAALPSVLEPQLAHKFSRNSTCYYLINRL